MPKSKPSLSQHLRNLISQFGNDVFRTDGTVLFCQICDKKVDSEKKFRLQQHISSMKHKHGIERLNTKKQCLLNFSSVTNDGICTFSFDLCDALLSANIPLGKLNNFKFRKFLENYMNKSIPDESTLRKTYVKICYEKTINRIRNAVINKKIWVSIDETTDVNGRYIANVVIGTLETENEGVMFLLTTEILERVNYQTICKLFDESMLLLWPTGIPRHNILLFVTDAAPYMNKAATGLRYLYTKMIHVTCVAHGLHRVAEEIRKNFPKIDLLIGSMKKVFLKAPSRVDLFRQIAPDLGLPPRPIITRWGTWLNAVNYYFENYETLAYILEKINCDDSVCVQIAQDSFNDMCVQCELAYITANFNSLAKTINKLEKRGESIHDTLNHITKVGEDLKYSEGCIAEYIYSKFLNVFQKNVGFSTIGKLNDILSGKSLTLESVTEDLSPNDACFFKYAPLTSVDVERSFSKYKNLLADNRRSYTFENLRMVYVVYCNNLEDS